MLALLIAGLLSVDGTLEDNGWQKRCECAGDVFQVKEGVLSMHCVYNPYKGTSYSRKARRFPERGELTYEVKHAGGTTHEKFCSIGFGRMLIYVRCDSLVRYFDYPEPRWKEVGQHRLPAYEWVKVKLTWDNVREKIRYYAGDMEIPSAVESGKILSDCEDGITIKVFNYGFSASTQYFRNFQLHELKDEDVNRKLPRTKAIVFRGIGSELQPIEEWTKNFDKKDILNFYLETRGSACMAINQFGLSAYPEETLIERAKLIILADMPLTEDILDAETQQNILKAKREGAKVIITEGLTGGKRNGNPDSVLLKEIKTSK